MGDVGYGQQTPGDSNDPLNLMSFVIKQAMLRLVTSKLVKVVAVHPGAGTPPKVGTVDVQPLVKQVDGGNNAVSHGVVYGVPYSRMAGGGAAFIADPVAGDVGIVVVMDRDSSAAKETWAESPPGSQRAYDLSDGFYVGGGLSTETFDRWVLLAADRTEIADKDGNSILLNSSGFTLTDKTGNVLKGDSAGLTATPRAGLPFTVNGNFVLNGNLQISGSVESETGGVYAGDIKTSGNVVARHGTGGSVGLATHAHAQGADGHGDSEQPTNAPTGGT